MLRVTLILGLCLAVAHGETTISTPPGSCPANSTDFPGTLEQIHTSDYYTSLEGGAQLFLDYQLCDGFITKIRFLTAQTVVWGLHVAVFRGAFINSYRLVWQEYINGVSTNQPGDHWMEIKPKTPFHVKNGDYLGMYYDQNVTNQGELTRALRSRSFPRSANKGSTQNNTANTYVWLLTAADLVVNQTLLEYKNSDQIRREPALYVTLSRFPNPDVAKPGSRAYYMLYGNNGNNDSSGSSRRKENNQFRDLRCNLNPPNATNSKCGNATTMRFFWHSSDRKCYAFLGCPQNKTNDGNKGNRGQGQGRGNGNANNNNNNGNRNRGQGQGQGRGNDDGDKKKQQYISWDNNFDSKTECEQVCTDSINKRQTSSSTTTQDSGRVVNGVAVNNSS